MTSTRNLLKRRLSSTDAILAVVCLAQFMVILDVSIVNVALPSIGRDLHYTPIGLQWVVNAYVLTFAGFLLLGGRAADLFGRRRVYLGGLALFSVASLVGGFAHTSTWLTVARSVQGVGGAILSPATLTIIVTTFSERRLVKALGIWSALGGAGGAAGVILGGVLTAELSWRWVLFVNVPIGVVTAVVALQYLSEHRRTDGARGLDLGGSVLVTAGLALLAYGIVGTDQYPWTSAHTVLVLAAAVVLLVLLVCVQRRVREPLVPLRLFRSRWVTGANVTMLLAGAVFFSMWYFLSLYLQDVLGYGPLRTGVAFLPMSAAIVIGAQGSARLLPRVGVRPLLVTGTLMAVGGFAWLSRIGSGADYWSVVFGAGIIAAGAIGVLFTPLASAATTGVDRREAGLASGVLNTSRQVGGSIGLAALATAATDRSRALAHGAAPAAGVPSGRPLRADARRNRRRILEAAEETFAREGIAVPVDEVPRRAGGGVGPLCRHFPTKESLFEAIVLTRLDRLRQLCEADQGDPTEVFFQTLVRVAEEVRTKQDLIEALGESAADFKTRCATELGALERAVDDLRRRAVEAGGGRPHATPAPIIGLCAGATTHVSVGARRQQIRTIKCSTIVSHIDPAVG